MKIMRLVLSFISCAYFLAADPVSADSCSSPSLSSADLAYSLDSHLISHSCDQAFIDQAWDWFDFKESYWNDGFGFYNVCNPRLPLARTLNAMVLMKDASFKWYDWSSDHIDDLRSRCYKSSGKKNVLATTWTGFFADDRTELYFPFFYGSYDVVRRASTITHEARHYSKGHNGGASCLRKASCDSSWGYGGANQYQVVFLRDLFCSASDLVSPTMRRYASDKGDSIINDGFVAKPTFAFIHGLTCSDADGDFVPDFKDNCPGVSNDTQADTDGDGVGDACDACPGIWDANMQADWDKDGTGVSCDNCPVLPNPDQANHDGDVFGDACDNCPYVSNVQQTDFDGDGLGNACDPDDDNDGVENNVDNCRFVSNPGQADSDHDGLGDSCDNCADVSNKEQIDRDCDGIGDGCDDYIDIVRVVGCSGPEIPVEYDRFWHLKNPGVDQILWGREEILVNPLDTSGYEGRSNSF